MKEVYGALENAAVDVYGFSVVCQGGVTWLAEPDVLDTLLLGLENFWFTEDDSGKLSHREFREEFFRSVWEKGKGRRVDPRSEGLPLGHQEMKFYKLSPLARAAVYLRSKKQMPYSSIALILGAPEATVRSEIERSREYLLGRHLRDFQWGEEDF